MADSRPGEGARPAPLNGVRVLDLSRLLPGPLCAQHLADLGAHVIKIEEPVLGDYARAALRDRVNRGKEGLSLNLKSQAGREVFLKLVDDADVVIESFRPGTMQRLGLGYDVLAARNPAIVYCAISGYGQDGPRRDAAGHDINYLAVSGVLDMTGQPGGPPALPGFLISDILGGTLSAALGILAALLDARATHRGRFIDVSMADAVMAHCVVPLAEFNESASVHTRGTGSHTGGAPRYNVYATRDNRYLAVGAQEKKFWDALCEVLDVADLKSQHSPGDAEAVEVKARLRQAFARRDADDWLARFDAADCCVTLVLTYEEALRDAGFRARGTVRHHGDGPALALGLPFVMSDLDDPCGRSAPARGEHSAEILARLGYSVDAIALMRDSGVI